MELEEFNKLNEDDQAVVMTYEQLHFGPAKKATPPEYMCLLDRKPPRTGVVRYEVERLTVGKELGMGWELFHDEGTNYELVARARAFEWTEEHGSPTRVLAVKQRRRYSDPVELEPICYFYMRDDEKIYISFRLDDKQEVEQCVTFVPERPTQPHLMSLEELRQVAENSLRMTKRA